MSLGELTWSLSFRDNRHIMEKQIVWNESKDENEGKWEAQRMGYNIGPRMHRVNTGNIANIFNNCKWKMTFKIV